MTTVHTFPVESMRIVLDVHINATAQQIFSALTTGVALWWDAAHLENKKLARDLILEPRLGGRFYETWESPATDRDGALLGTVIQIRKWQVVKMAGFFGLEDRCAYGVVCFRLARAEQGTTVHLSHEAVGELDDAVREKTSRAWRDLLQALKTQVEELHSSGLRVDPAFDNS